MKLSKNEFLIIIILALLTALEALSIDLYLPAFKAISQDLKTDIGKVQISLSNFLGGFAIGQLLWGPLSDRLGRKLPILIAIAIYSISSLLILTTSSIEELWFYRFLQAFSGSAGVVIARAVVTDIFDKSRTTNIFAVLALIAGIAPIIGPSTGNLLLNLGHWHNVFIAMATMGFSAILLVLFFLPETLIINNQNEHTKIKKNSIIGSYLSVLKNKTFLIYTLIGSMAYSGLMIYISNSPFLVMEKGGFSGSQYSLVFASNAIGMMRASYSVNYLLKYFHSKQIVKVASIVQFVIGLMIVLAVWINLPIIYLLILIFLYLIPIGLLFPTITALALENFKKDSGTASAVFGFVQLLITFILSAIIGWIQAGSIFPMAFGLFLCAFISLVLSLISKTKINN